MRKTNLRSLVEGNEIFNFELKWKPRNGTSIDVLSHYVVKHYYEKMPKGTLLQRPLLLITCKTIGLNIFL